MPVSPNIRLKIEAYFHPSGNRPVSASRDLFLALGENQEFFDYAIQFVIESLERKDTWDEISWYMESLFELFQRSRHSAILPSNVQLKEAIARKIESLGIPVYANSSLNEVQGCELSLSILGIELFTFQESELKTVTYRNWLGFKGTPKIIVQKRYLSRPVTKEEILHGLRTGEMPLFRAA